MIHEVQIELRNLLKELSADQRVALMQMALNRKMQFHADTDQETGLPCVYQAAAQMLNETRTDNLVLFGVDLMRRLVGEDTDVSPLQMALARIAALSGDHDACLALVTAIRVHINGNGQMRPYRNEE